MCVCTVRPEKSVMERTHEGGSKVPEERRCEMGVRNELKLSTWCVTPTAQTSSVTSLNITSAEIFSLPASAAVQHNAQEFKPLALFYCRNLFHFLITSSHRLLQVKFTYYITYIRAKTPA